MLQSDLRGGSFDGGCNRVPATKSQLSGNLEFVQIEAIRNDRDAKWTPAPQPNSNQFFFFKCEEGVFHRKYGWHKNCFDECYEHL